MQVEDLYNYGQDIFSMRANSQVPPLEKLKLLPAFLSYYGNLVRALGLHGVLRLRRDALREFEHWRQRIGPTCGTEACPRKTWSAFSKK
jgi:hypothetical protein